MKTFEETVNTIRAAYIDTMGLEKWNSLTDEQKHDVIMITAKDILKALDIIANA